MMRVSVSERGFAFALGASVLAHLGLLLLLPAAASFPPRHEPAETAPRLTAFLVPAPLPGNGAVVRIRAAAQRDAGKTLRVAAAIDLRTGDSEQTPLTDKRHEEMRMIASLTAARSDPDQTHHAAPAAVDRRVDSETATPPRKDGSGSMVTDDPPTATSPTQGQSGKASESFLGSGKRSSGGGDGEGLSLPRQGGGVLLAAKDVGFSIARQGSLSGSPRWDGGASGTGVADALPRYAHNARPVYPRLARLRGYEGIVVLKVEVLTDGTVGRIEIGRSAGYDILDRAALAAVRNWKFEPGRKEGRAVAMGVDVPVRFVLRDQVP
jgi:TonB family protein